MRTALLRRYGTRAALIVTASYVLSTLIGRATNYGVWEILGYLTILLGLSMIWFGTRAYRNDLTVPLTFGRALTFGLLLAVITALAFSLIDLVYVTLIDPDFLTNYLAAQPAEVRAEGAAYANPAFMFGVMFLTVFLLGVMVSLVTSLILYERTGGRTAG